MSRDVGSDNKKRPARRRSVVPSDGQSVLIGYGEWLDRQVLSPAAARVFYRTLNSRGLRRPRDDLSTPEEIAAAKQLIRAGLFRGSHEPNRKRAGRTFPIRADRPSQSILRPLRSAKPTIKHATNRRQSVRDRHR